MSKGVRVLYCGADIQGNDLILVSLTPDETGKLSYANKQSTKIELGGDDQEAVRALYKSLAGFVTTHGIETIGLRGRAKGMFKSGGRSFKIETLVQMLEGVRVTLIAPGTLTAWAKKGTILPSKYSYQQKAMEAACYMAKDSI